MISPDAQWIWINEAPQPEEYGCFLEKFTYYGAGSLCHGWSAMPVYYYNKLM